MMSSQELVQNIMPASQVDGDPQNAEAQESFANLFEDVGLVKNYLDALGIQYNPNNIADLLLEYDNNADRVNLVVNRILDDPPDVGIVFESIATNNTLTASSSASNVASANDPVEQNENMAVQTQTVKNKSPTRVSYDSDEELAPSPSKLLKSLNPEENPFLVDCTKATSNDKDSFSINELQRISDLNRVSEITAQFLESVKTPSSRSLNSTSSAFSSNSAHSPVSELTSMYDNLNKISSITDKFKNSRSDQLNRKSFTSAGVSKQHTNSAISISSGPSATITKASDLSLSSGEPVERTANIFESSHAGPSGFTNSIGFKTSLRAKLMKSHEAVVNELTDVVQQKHSQKTVKTSQDTKSTAKNSCFGASSAAKSVSKASEARECISDFSEKILQIQTELQRLSDYMEIPESTEENVNTPDVIDIESGNESDNSNSLVFCMSDVDDVLEPFDQSEESNTSDVAEILKLAQSIGQNSGSSGVNGPKKNMVNHKVSSAAVPNKMSNSGISTTVEPTPPTSADGAKLNPKYLPNLMEIFPDADMEYLRGLCVKAESETADVHTLQQLIDEVLGNPDYPRQNAAEVETMAVASSMTVDEMYRNIIAIFPDIDPEFLEMKCLEFTDDGKYFTFINDLLASQQVPPPIDKKDEEKTEKPKVIEKVKKQKVTEKPMETQAVNFSYLKDRYKLIKASDILNAFTEEKFDVERTCQRLNNHKGLLRKTKRNIRECKLPAKEDNATESISPREWRFSSLASGSGSRHSDHLRREVWNSVKANSVEKMTRSLANAALHLVDEDEKRSKETSVSRCIHHDKKEQLKNFIAQPSKSKSVAAAACLAVSVASKLKGRKGALLGSKSVESSYPTLPFEVLEELLASRSVTTDGGVYIRQIALDLGVVDLILACLAALTHCQQSVSPPHSEPQPSTSTAKKTASKGPSRHASYWATGTGYGTGSTAQSRNVQQAVSKQKCEESLTTIVLQVLSSFIYPRSTEKEAVSAHENPAQKLPPLFYQLLEESCLLTALLSYLRNDSVLDISRHIPLYRSILRLLLVIASNEEYVQLLFPRCSADLESSVYSLLLKMKKCIDNYIDSISILFWDKANKSKSQNNSNGTLGSSSASSGGIDQDDEGLASLVPDIESIAVLIQAAADKSARNGDLSNGALSLDTAKKSIEHPLARTLEGRYLEFMKALQFDHFDMIVEDSETNVVRFSVSHHYEAAIREDGDGGRPARMKRLAQEANTLSTSLPLSFSSSVFVRCDSDRLDVMKVLITGPAETPYMNGCFEFDVYFPKDYPNSPLKINLETTGRKSVRFNPNLYNCGKVCLSILNTWHGRPEEEWNAQTSSFLQVLVSIQSLILVPEPYFNEPGYETSQGTPNGTKLSGDYNRNICQATLRWAMVEQLKNPSPCFKKIIQSHFWMKRNEICMQIKKWITDVETDEYLTEKVKTDTISALRGLFDLLRKEIRKLTPPAGLEDLTEAR